MSDEDSEIPDNDFASENREDFEGVDDLLAPEDREYFFGGDAETTTEEEAIDEYTYISHKTRVHYCGDEKITIPDELQNASPFPFRKIWEWAKEKFPGDNILFSGRTLIRRKFIKHTVVEVKD